MNYAIIYDHTYMDWKKGVKFYGYMYGGQPLVKTITIVDQEREINMKNKKIRMF